MRAMRVDHGETPARIGVASGDGTPVVRDGIIEAAATERVVRRRALGHGVARVAIGALARALVGAGGATGASGFQAGSNRVHSPSPRAPAGGDGSVTRHTLPPSSPIARRRPSLDKPMAPTLPGNGRPTPLAMSQMTTWPRLWRATSMVSSAVSRRSTT